MSRNKAPRRSRRRTGWLAAVVGSVLLWSAGSGAISSSLKATIIDRDGNHHEVDKLVYQGRLEIEYYVDGQRRLVPLQDIDRILFMGHPGDEEQALSVRLRTGRVETGSMLSGASVAPHEDAMGAGGGTNLFSGSTDLGPFSILVSNVREIIMRHPASLPPARELRFRATVITTEGKRFEVENLRCFGQTRLDYNIGRKRRFVDLEKVARIDFAEGGFNEEQRPVTIFYWSGKTVQGTVDVSTVRLSGETDKSYYDRVHAALTGRMETGASLSLGLHLVKQIRFHPEEEEEEEQPQDGPEPDEEPTAGKKEAGEDK